MGDDRNIFTIIKEYIKGNGRQRYQIRLLNCFEYSTVNTSFIESITPDPVDIPTSPQDLDPQVMIEYITQEDLYRLWNCTMDDTVSKKID